MTSITASHAKTKFGELLDTAQQEPVEIVRNGRSIAVVVSYVEFDRLKRLEKASGEMKIAALDRLKKWVQQPEIHITQELSDSDARLQHLNKKNFPQKEQ